MNLNIYDNLNKDENFDIKKLIEEISNLIKNSNEKNINIKEQETDKMELEPNEHRKEGHLYLVTEDRLGEVYLWDFTEKAETEFLEKDLPQEVLQFATEGAMLQFENGTYTLYSPDGYDMLENEEGIQ